MLTENSTVVTSSSLGDKVIGSVERIAPGVYIKKEITANTSSTDKTLSDKTYYDEGIKFREISFIGTAPSAGGTLVRDVKEYEHYGETQIIVNTQTWAELKSTSYTTYGTERFILPGVLKSSRVSGLKTVPPKDIMVSVRHEHTISNNSSAGGYLYEAPSAFMSLTVNFLDADDNYSESWGGSNYARTANTSRFSLKKGDTYMGNIVESATFEESGEDSRDFVTRQSNPLSRTSTLIYSKNGLNIFRNTTTYLNQTLSLPSI